jgi:hypothetical protein
MTKLLTEDAWATELHKFTNRNAGRVTKLEIDNPDFGAQSQEHGFPLRGIAYDAKDAQVLITLGDQGRAGRHLTHAIKNADAIYVLVDMRGRDEALAVSHNNTQTLLRFLDL